MWVSISVFECKGLTMRSWMMAAVLAMGVHAGAFAAAPLSGDATAGQEKSAACVACHGVDGNSVDPVNAKIAGQHAGYIARHLKLFQNGERENAIMSVQAANLSAQDMADLGAYFATQKTSVGVADDKLVVRGQQLYRGGNANGLPSCMGCHGPTGRGNPAANYPALAGQHTDYTKTQLERFRAGMVYGKDAYDNKLVMSQVAKSLSDEDILALSSYIQGLHAQ
jgi:cytochrome c553